MRPKGGGLTRATPPKTGGSRTGYGIWGMPLSGRCGSLSSSFIPAGRLKTRRRTTMRWREIGPYLRELWQRPAGPMNWKNPIRVFAVLGWLVVQGFVLLGWAGFRVFQGFLLLGWVVFRVGQFVAGLPPLLLFFFAAVGWAGWSFVHRPFPPLDEHPILVLVEYHTPISSMLWSSGTTLRPSLSSC